MSSDGFVCVKKSSDKKNLTLVIMFISFVKLVLKMKEKKTPLKLGDIK